MEGFPVITYRLKSGTVVYKCPRITIEEVQVPRRFSQVVTIHRLGTAGFDMQTLLLGCPMYLADNNVQTLLPGEVDKGNKVTDEE